MATITATISRSLLVLLLATQAAALSLPRCPPAAAAAAAAATICCTTQLAPLPILPAFAEEPAKLATKSAAEFTKVEGFEDFAAQGGKMEANPNCFFDECKEQTQSCFTNPACLKGITCLGNCRGEQLCATQCFARFGSEKLNAWLGCTLEDKECVTTGVKQDTSKYYANPPPAMRSFKPSDLQGKWYKVLGYNPKYDTCERAAAFSSYTHFSFIFWSLTAALSIFFFTSLSLSRARRPVPDERVHSVQGWRPRQRHPLPRAQARRQRLVAEQFY